MAFAYAVDPTVPAGGEAASLGDDRIREFKNAMIERVNSRFVSIDADPWILKSPVSGGNVQSLVPTTDNTYALGTAALRFSDLRAATVTVSALGKIYPDGGGDTYIQESSANVMSFVAGAVGILTLITTGIYIPATTKLWLDGGGDTNISESSANVIDFTVGGNVRFSVHNGLSGIIVPPANKIFPDGGGDTYAVESSANVFALVVGGSTALTSTFSQTLHSFGAWSTSFSQGAKHYLDGGAANNYIWSSAANVVGIVAGGTGIMNWQSTGVYRPSGTKSWADGGGDTYTIESAPNQYDIIVGGSTLFRGTATSVTITGTLAANVTNGSFIVQDSGGSAYQMQVRPSAGKEGWLTFTESTIADRWIVGIKNGDSKLYFSSGNIGARTDLYVMGDYLYIKSVNPGVFATAPAAPAIQNTGLAPMYVYQDELGVKLWIYSAVDSVWHYVVLT